MLTDKHQAVVILIFLCVVLVLFAMYPTMRTREDTFRAKPDFAKAKIWQKSGEKHVKHTNSSMWYSLFSYVPYAIEDCTTLFDGAGEYTPEFTAKYNKFLAKVETVKLAEGTSAKYKEEFLAYIKSAQASFVRTVCETGFNGGHSAFAWLAANSLTHVYSFDLGSHSYAKTMAQYLMDRFPGRLNVTWGDSVKTLPMFREEHPDIKCDLMIIDGGHTYDICKSDLQNFRKMASSDNILIIDNFPDKRWKFIPKLGRCWEEAKRSAEIAEIYKCHYKDFNQGFSVARIMVD